MQVVGVSADHLADELAAFIFAVAKPGQDEALRLASELDLSMSQLRSLFVLDGGGDELAVHELAERLGLSMAATGRAVEHLVRSGLVTRREDERDRRVKRIAITDVGRTALREFADAKRERLRRFAAELSEEERAALSRAMAPVLARGEGACARGGGS